MDKVNLNYKETIETEKEIMNFGEVCDYLGICRNTLTKMIENSEIKYCKMGVQYKFRRSDILHMFDYRNGVSI